MATSTLLAIKNKVRRLTRSLSEAQLTDTQLEEYINTYVLYDFPETLRLFNLKTTFSFYTLPYVDTYSTSSNSDSPLYDFKNKYITTDQPVYIGGRQAMFSESRQQFYGIYPLVNSIQSIGVTGDSSVSSFSGTINSQQSNSSGTSMTLLPNNVLFTGIDINENALAMQDSPLLDSVTGNPTIYGQLYNAISTNSKPIGYIGTPYGFSTGIPTDNYINYLTGEYVVTFDEAPISGSNIYSQTIPVNPSMPQALLFFDGNFVVRPVPDQSYKVEMEVFMQPSELLADDSVPELSEWWQLIAFNAAKKVFEDRMDYDSLNLMMPSLKEQERLVNRRTIKQYTSQRTATIYSETNAQGIYGAGWFNGGGQF